MFRGYPVKSNYRAPVSLRVLGALAVASAATPAFAQAADPVIAAQEPGSTLVDSVDIIAERLNEHPYADPEAPYRTERSASPKLTVRL